MKLTLDYGRTGLEVELPETAQVIRSKFLPEFIDEEQAILDAIQTPISSQPLSEKLKLGDRVIIVHTDITRATPNDCLLPVLINYVEQAGIHRSDITLLNGLGTHRPQTDQELREMLGDFIVDNYRCIQHDANDDENLVSMGKTSFGNPVRINQHYLHADVRILTGFIEPHLFAGFSGGPKGVLPALAGKESVASNHTATNISHPNANWGITIGNPIWEEMKEVALSTNPTFLVNVTLNAKQKITGVFAGDLLAAHQMGCDFVKENAMVPVEQLFDVVITTNSGYPLDQNLYQSVKGMRAAHNIVKPGGTIIIATACEDGLPDHGGYVNLLQRGGSPAGILKMVNQPGFNEPDQWQVQIQAQIQKDVDVYVFSEGLTDEQIRTALFLPCRNIPALIEALKGRIGRDYSLAVLPEGPQTVAYHQPSL